jgi:hypothetical protein
MKKYEVKITEQLSRIIEVNATDEDDALYQVRQLYAEEEIVLDYADHDFTDFEIEE